MDSDMRGEFAQGDTIGLWTLQRQFGSGLPDAGLVDRRIKTTIVDDMAAFLTGRPYEKRAILNRVMPALNQVIKNSERITVILIFDGTDLIQGTPFDKDINELQKKYARELRTAHVPFVTRSGGAQRRDF